MALIEAGQTEQPLLIGRAPLGAPPLLESEQVLAERWEPWVGGVLRDRCEQEREVQEHEVRVGVSRRACDERGQEADQRRRLIISHGLGPGSVQAEQGAAIGTGSGSR